VTKRLSEGRGRATLLRMKSAIKARIDSGYSLK
jgi:hypothetical protein